MSISVRVGGHDLNGRYFSSTQISQQKS